MTYRLNQLAASPLCHSIPRTLWAGLVDWQAAECSGLLAHGRDRFGAIRGTASWRRQRRIGHTRATSARHVLPHQARCARSSLGALLQRSRRGRRNARR